MMWMWDWLYGCCYRHWGARGNSHALCWRPDSYDPVQLQKMLRRLESYAARKGLTVNVQKSYIINFNAFRNSAVPVFRLYNQELEERDSFTFPTPRSITQSVTLLSREMPRRLLVCNLSLTSYEKCSSLPACCFFTLYRRSSCSNNRADTTSTSKSKIVKML